jgi:hypothetical protein
MRMRTLSVLTCAILIMMAGSALAEERTETVVIQLTDEQVSIIVHNCPRDETVTIDLTPDQIAIIIHDFPQVEAREITVGRINLLDDNTVELMPEGRTGIRALTRAE